MRNCFTKKIGFTLVELLIVIAIIGVLVTIISVAVLQSKRKSRDSQRVSDLTLVANALQTYYADNQSYPDVSSCVNAGMAPLVAQKNGYRCLVENFLLKPSDPAHKYIDSCLQDPSASTSGASMAHPCGTYADLNSNNSVGYRYERINQNQYNLLSAVETITENTIVVPGQSWRDYKISNGDVAGR